MNVMKIETKKIPLKDLHPNTGQVSGLPKNPRFVRDEKFKKLKQSLEEDPEFMEVRPIVAYDNGGELVIVGGNMRYRALKDMGEKDAHVIILPQETPVEKLRAFTIKDNSGFGEWSWDDLANEWDDDELKAWGVDVPNSNDEENNYSRKIESPVYTIKGDCPGVEELCDGRKTENLKARVLAADIPEEIKVFLCAAAERHRVFNFTAIAEFYAHQERDVQELMEESALVIIDFGKSIENGFVEMTEKLFDVIGMDYDEE